MLIIVCFASAGISNAQRADENAITAAADAFGTSVGYQSVGLYSENDARGFNPQQAGNLRIEGLYYDQQTWTTGDCMVRGTTMRVGVAAQSYSFPAPTGIADIALRTPGDTAISSLVVTRGPFDTASVDVEAQVPLVDRVLGVDLCAGYRKNAAIDTYRKSHEVIFGTTFRWRPAISTEVIPFVSLLGGGARQIVPGVYTDGTLPLSLFRTNQIAAEDWATWGWHQLTVGGIAKSHLSDGWSWAAGVFHSRERDPLGYQPYLNLQAQGTADSVLDVAPPFSATSTSGEVRMTRRFGHEVHREKIQFALRGRSVVRDFGGDAIVDLGTSAFPSQSGLTQPPWSVAPQSRDSTREIDMGFTFDESWQHLGSFGVGILKDHYLRQVQISPGTTDTNRTSPWLLNLRFETEHVRGLSVYGSFVQGLEDSALAPVSAVNRNEPPPATRTWQVDGGIRWSRADMLQFILGVFDIRKPYFNSDQQNVYTRLGRVEHRGLETSLSFNEGGLTLLLGAVYLRPRVQRDIPEPGATGNIPLGPVPLRVTSNIDYAPARWGPWAASLQWNRLSPRVATTDNHIYLPALATLDAGIRYHVGLLAHPWTVRVDGANLTGARGLHVSSLDLVLPEEGRRYMLTVATDF